MQSRLTVIEDEISVKKLITRIAHEITERNSALEDVVLIGVRTRGEPIAERIRALIKKTHKIVIPIGALDITFHRDDFRERLVVPQVEGTHIDFSIDGKIVILVDDVLYTGRTVRSALEALISFGRPKKIQLAVVVDRGHREMPIKADYVGKNIPTSEGEHVKVHIREIDGADEIVLMDYKREV